MREKTYLILGGGGMIGFQVAHRICRHLDPDQVILVSLYQQEVREAVTTLQKEFPDVELEGFWGDIFIRKQFNVENRQQRLRRSDLLQDPAFRTDLYADLFGEPQTAYENSQLVELILEHQPEVIVDAINTATAISYQDIYTASQITRRNIDQFLDTASPEKLGQDHQEHLVKSVESLLISQYIPQLIRHVVLINEAMRTVGTRIYLKVGTTGTGGMGLNIPYTHGEDKPSAKLMSKTAIAFAHTGLLFLLARTQGGPIVKEIKPAAMVGWVDTTLRSIRRKGKPAYIYASRKEKLSGTLALTLDEAGFDKKERLKVVVADTGENGVFAKGEFETITALRQMEFLTPEEIARAVVLELQGINTGTDVIPALDSAIMGPTYRAGFLRRQAIEELHHLEEETGTYSVALGELGPPELSKLLWEAFLLKQKYKTLTTVLEFTEDELSNQGVRKKTNRPPELISTDLVDYLDNNPDIKDQIASVGLPILMPDGESLIRGPFVRIPEVPGRKKIPLSSAQIDQWAKKGWVDLRPQNFELWQDRFKRMRRARQRLKGKGSAAVNREAYLFEKIFIGEVVGWVFNNEMGGYRIK